LSLTLITPDKAHVETDEYEPTVMKSFSYQTKFKNPQTGEMMDGWVYYDNDQRLLLNSAGRETESYYDTIEDTFDFEGNPIAKTVNKYGIIPVVPFHCCFPTDEFIDVGWSEDAYNASMVIGVLNTYMNYLVKTQSFKQIVISADQASEAVKNGILDPSFPLMLDKGDSAVVLDLNTQLAAINQVITSKIMAIAAMYGINEDNLQGNKSSVRSGFSLKVSNQSLEEIRVADVPLCNEVELNLFNVIRTVNNVEFPTMQIPENLEMKWTPGEIEYPETWTDTEKKWGFEFAAGVSNAIDYIISKDPQISRVDAMKQLQNIAVENKLLQPVKSLAEIIGAQIAGGTTGGAAVFGANPPASGAGAAQ
jgi:hypothetical protein